jgi:UDP-N-acetylmuramyl tripeptide synthase
MGEIAGKLCDLAVVTSDNPRTEVPERIIAEIEDGVRKKMPRKFSVEDRDGWVDGVGYLVMPDRAEAIREAIRWSAAGDVVLIAGKGHETYQIIGKKKRDFDDRRVAAEAFRSSVVTQESKSGCEANV